MVALPAGSFGGVRGTTCAPAVRVSAQGRPPCDLQLAGLLYPLNIDLLTWLVWLVSLVPAFETSTAEEAARNFVWLVFRDMGLPGSCLMCSSQT